MTRTEPPSKQKRRKTITLERLSQDELRAALEHWRTLPQVVGQVTADGRRGSAVFVRAADEAELGSTRLATGRWFDLHPQGPFVVY